MGTSEKSVDHENVLWYHKKTKILGGEKVKLAEIFGSGMVIQRDRPIPVWGCAHEGSQVTVNLGEEQAETVAVQGKWRVTLPPQRAQTGLTMTVTGEGETLTLENVAVGDVFLAGGQSNMEFHMRYDGQLEEERPHCADPLIRFFDCPEVSYEGQREDFDYSQMGFWRPCDGENLEYYSAVGYYFAKALRQAQDIPVGIVGCIWGGTVACAWMDEKQVKRHGQEWLDEYLAGLDKLPADYEAAFRVNPMNARGTPFSNPFGEKFMPPPGVSREEQLALMSLFPAQEYFGSIGPCHQNRPGRLYEYMLKPLAPFAVKGVLWYQGESDETHAEIYDGVLSDMIDCWRELWGEELPFFLVQLAPFGAWLASTGEKFPLLRAQQEKVARSKEKVWMVSSSDAGNEWDIHPKYKRPIGERLALAVREHLYGEPLDSAAPVGVSARRVGETVKVKFAHAGEGLHLEGEAVNGLTLLGEGGEVTGYTCRVEDDCLVLEGAQLAQGAVQVQFACTAYYQVNLYNSMGLPAIPFVLDVIE